LNGSAYALRGYGVTLGSSSSHDPFFSRKAASAYQLRCCHASVFHGRDDRARLFRTPRGSAIRNLGGSILRHDPLFSRKAASAYHLRCCHTSVFHSRDDCAPLSVAPRAAARFVTWEGPSSGMTHSSTAKRRPRTNEIAAPVSFTVETTVLPSLLRPARQRDSQLGRVHPPA
jgi:hypothetical protein